MFIEGNHWMLKRKQTNKKGIKNVKYLEKKKKPKQIKNKDKLPNLNALNYNTQCLASNIKVFLIWWVVLG